MDAELDNLAQYETSVSLEDGSQILLRALHPEDAEACVNFIHSINGQTRFLRFGHPKEAPTLESLRNFWQGGLSHCVCRNSGSGA